MSNPLPCAMLRHSVWIASKSGCRSFARRVCKVANGDPPAAAASLLQNSQAAGLFVVSVGQIERFVPEVPGHGPAWVAQVVESGGYRQATAALDLVGQVASGLERQISLLTNC